MEQTVGKRIHDRRVARGMSQVELGGGRYSGSYISHLESGRRTPNYQVLTHLAERLGVAPAEIDLSMASPPDVETTTAMLRAQDEFRACSWAAAARDSELAADLAARRGHPDREWEARYLQALALVADGRYQLGGDLAHELSRSRLAAQSRQLFVMAKVLESRARRSTGSSLRACDAADAALRASEAGQVSVGERAHALMAAISSRAAAGQAGQAEDQVAELRARLGQFEGQALGIMLWQLGAYDQVRGKVEQGLAELKEAAGMLSPQADLRAWARLRRVTGHYLMRAGRLDEARDHLELASSALRLVGNSSDLFDLHLDQGRLLHAAGDDVAAAKLLEMADDESVAHDPHGESAYYALRSEVYAALNRDREAAEAQQRSEEILREAGQDGSSGR